jgi:hypothetical protein
MTLIKRIYTDFSIYSITPHPTGTPLKEGNSFTLADLQFLYVVLTKEASLMERGCR